MVVLPLYLMPESTWNMLCNAAVVLGHVCDAPNIAMSEQPEAKIMLLVLFVMMLSVLILMPFVAMMVLNLAVEGIHFLINKKKSFSISRLQHLALPVLAIAFTIVSLYLFSLLFVGEPDIHIVESFSVLTTAFITILLAVITTQFSNKYKREMEKKLDKLNNIDDKLTGIDDKLTDIGNNLNDIKSTLGAMDKKLDKISNNS